MNKKPILVRIIVVIIVIAIFAWSMFPLTQQDFYKVLYSLSDHSQVIENVIKLAKEKQAKDPSLYSSVAVDDAAQQLDVSLVPHFKLQDIYTNSDVIRAVRYKCASSIKLGLDLNGGTEFDVTVVPNKENKGKDAVSESTLRNRVMDILRNRINKSGLVEPEIAAEGSNRISIKIPVSTQAQKNEYMKLIEMSAQLEFRFVTQNNEQLLSQYMADPKGFVPPVGVEKMSMVESDRFGKKHVESCFVEIHPAMSGTDITNAFVATNQYGQRQIELQFNTKGAQEFGNVTAANVGRRLAIVLDGTLYSAPTIQGAIYGGNASITGDFSQDEAQNIATALACGNLPATIKIDSTFDTAPTLGKEAVNSGMMAAIIGLVLVGLFMLMYYRKAGLVADVALLINVILIIGAMASLGATLTLPGIAGIILTIGLSVDANVLIYERIREELDSGKVIWNAIDIGYQRAFKTILDSNVTLLIVSLILYWQGAGPIKGFGITLGIGIVSSMFTAIFVTRIIFDMYGRFFHIKKLSMMRFLSNTKIPFLHLWKYAISLSAAMMLISIILIGVNMSDHHILGVDFTGGTQLVLNYDKYSSQNEIKDALKKIGYDASISYKSSPTEGNKVEILLAGEQQASTSNGTAQKIVTLLNEKFPKAKFSEASENIVGGFVGEQFAWSAIIAVILSAIGMMIYVSLRFEPRYAMAVIFALMHDLILGTGVLMILHRQISLTVIAALLTAVGYSINESIIIFDRIRENIKLRKGMGYRDIIDLSINQTLSRTIITASITFFVVLVLFIFGGVAINSFALVMMVGIAAGTYSSIFVSSPLIAHWHKKVKGILD